MLYSPAQSTPAKRDEFASSLICVAASSALWLSGCAEPTQPAAVFTATTTTANLELPSSGNDLGEPDIAPADISSPSAPVDLADNLSTIANTPITANTSTALASLQTIPAAIDRAPKNLTGLDFINDGAADVTGSTVSINIAALSDSLVTGYFVAEDATDATPATPSSDDPGWIAVSPASAYGATNAYTLQHAYADGTNVNLFVWFKDATNQVSRATTGQVAIHRSDRIVTASAPYVADTSVGFDGWANETTPARTSGTHSRSKAAAHVERALISPPFVLPAVGASDEILLNLSEWYQFDADASVLDGARANVQIAVEQAPGSWSDWTDLAGAGNTLSSETTSPQLDLTAYANSTIKLRVGVAGNLTTLSDWGLTEISLDVASPIGIEANAMYSQHFEAGWNGWSTVTPNWSISGPKLDGTIVAPEGLYYAAAQPHGAETGDFALTSPTFHLPNSSAIEVSFNEWHALHYGEAKLQVSYFDAVTGWSDWEDQIRAISGRSSNWETVQTSLTRYAGLRVRLRLFAHLTPGDEAWRIDELDLVAQ